MKVLLIPAALYFLVTAYFLFIEAKVLLYPFQDLFFFLANHAVQSLLLASVGFSLLFDIKHLNRLFTLVATANVAAGVLRAKGLEMQDLSEAVNRISLSLLVLGILVASLRAETQPSEKVAPTQASSQNEPTKDQKQKSSSQDQPQKPKATELEQQQPQQKKKEKRKVADAKKQD